MKISEIDKNLVFESDVSNPDMVWFNAKDAPFSIHGLAVHTKDDIFRRLPAAVEDEIGGTVARLSSNTSGGRVRFRTNSPYVAIKSISSDEEPIMPNCTATGQAGFDLFRCDNGRYLFVGAYMPAKRERIFTSSHPTIPIDGKMHTYIIHMPLYAPVDDLYIGLSKDAELEPPEPYAYDKPLVFYGSSITQGCGASRPGNAYPTMISRKLNADFINLGFSGSCLGGQPISNYMASLDPLVFICDYDNNSLDPEWLDRTHFPIYETFRRAHPTTPYIMVSKPDFKAWKYGDKERHDVIVASFAKALARGDRHVYFVDGAHLFDGDFRECCTIDGAHPNDLGYAHMARGIGAAIERAIREME